MDTTKHLTAPSGRFARPFPVATLGYVLAFALAVSAGAGKLDPVGQLLWEGFEALAQAQYKMHLASQNINADGKAEFAVLMDGERGFAQLQTWSSARQGVAIRDSVVPGWHVVAFPAEHAAQLSTELSKQTFSRAVLQNRGLWICH